MFLQSLGKSWANWIGFLRIVAFFGFWNYFKFFVKKLLYRGKHVRYLNFKGFSIPLIGPIDTNDFLEAMNEDVAHFKTRDSDVFVVAFPKCGHHWSYDFINMLLRGNLDLDNVAKEKFFIEYMLPIARGMKPFDNLPSPRMVFTHIHADALPEEVFTKKRRIVRLIRNPKDVAVSFYHHRKIGFPHLSWEVFIDGLMDVLEGKSKSDDIVSWFAWETDAEAKMNKLDHSIVLYYEDLKDDMLPQLRRLAKFLGKEYDDAFLEQIATKTNLDYVKKNKDLSMHYGLMGGGGTLYRKGIIGDWKNHFTAEQNRRFDVIIDGKMADCPILKDIRYSELDKNNRD